jgi:hypothetical protein
VWVFDEQPAKDYLKRTIKTYDKQDDVKEESREKYI